VLGGLAAAGAGYAASHQTATVTSYGSVGRRQYFSTSTIQVYDPTSWILAGAAVGAATGVGIHQIGRAAGYEEQAAQGIFQHSTIHPGTTMVGQGMLKKGAAEAGALRLDVRVAAERTTFNFAKKTTSS
jgi:hypothetical protein